ncbi:hypothetical protein GCM10009557_25320 [Virgisporangium ochraceum]|uniref:Secreted protein n=1 Tax=Virgisporangium ochraceum TaxID=65505 RepID=A0A8J4A495_9ACTN|nr:hypothetical protein [Virgisporangium ochraceum]GIJ74866.1 hypothetical protein Voc01_097830 [Virgisporangium ochraceum]
MRTLSRLAGVTAVLALFVAAGLTATGPAGAAAKGCVRKGVAAGKPGDVHTVSAFVSAAKADGRTGESIGRALEKEWCLTNVGEEPAGQVQPFNTANDTDWYSMSLYYERDYGYYLAVAHWRWLNDRFTDDDWVTCINNEVGDDDGVALRLSGGEYQIISRFAAADGNAARNSYGNDFGYQEMPSSVVNQYGAGFKWQDSAKGMQSNGACVNPFVYDYSLYTGTVVIGFRALNGVCRRAQMFVDYVHTWDSTGVSSIGAGQGGFNVSFSNAGDSWADSEPGPTAQIC